MKTHDMKKDTYAANCQVLIFYIILNCLYKNKNRIVGCLKFDIYNFTSNISNFFTFFL